MHAALLALLAGADLKPLTYPELCKEVRSHKGKVVVVYFWASW